MTTPSFFRTKPNLCLLVLASSNGSRLFPMTSSAMPKHLLPIAGVPCLLRLLENFSHVPQVVVAISAEDKNTVSLLETVASVREGAAALTDGEGEQQRWTFDMKDRDQRVQVLSLSQECFGPVDALREVEETKIVHPSTRLLVVPGDLVLLQKDLNLDALLRPACTSSSIALLVDVGEVDEHGVPLKESAKAKKGGLARDKEDIEYIGLSYQSVGATNGEETLPRIVLKQSKLDVESDEDMTGSTAKLQVPKPLLRNGRLVVRTSWNDVHVYSFAPWVRRLLVSRKNLSSIQEDLLPLLISRQFRGKKAAFGKSLEEKQESDKEDEEGGSMGALAEIEIDENPFSIEAFLLPNKSMVRANTISSFQFACREAVANGASLRMPEESKWNGKFQTLVLSNSTLGAKINMKSTTVGSGCELGAKCRLNNVVIMDNVTIGENCSLQNTIIGPGAKLGNNCSLNDCQVGPGKGLPAGTKEKGESFLVEDMDAVDADVIESYGFVGQGGPQ